MPYNLPPSFLLNLHKNNKKINKDDKELSARNDSKSDNPFENDEEEDEDEDEDGDNKSDSDQDQNEYNDNNNYDDYNNYNNNNNNNNNVNDDNNKEHSYEEHSTSTSHKKSTHVIPISLAVTEFHFLILAKVQLDKTKKKHPIVERSRDLKSRDLKIRDSGKNNHDKSREKNILDNKSDMFLLCFSRLNGTLSQSINIKSQISKNKYQILKGSQQQQQRSISESRKKTFLETTSTVTSSSSSTSSSIVTSQEESMGMDGVEGIPLAILSDQKTRSVWLHTDRGLYQVQRVIRFKIFLSLPFFPFLSSALFLPLFLSLYLSLSSSIYLPSFSLSLSLSLLFLSHSLYHLISLFY